MFEKGKNCLIWKYINIFHNKILSNILLYFNIFVFEGYYLPSLIIVTRKIVFYSFKSLTLNQNT
jgi:hypothetical protein